MNKRTASSIITRLGWGAFFLILLFLAIQVMPRALGQRESSDVEAPLPEQQPTPLTPAGPAGGSTLSGTLGTAPAGGSTGTLATRINRPGGHTATCAGVTWPGNIGSGPFIYNVHPFINNTNSPICTTITLTMLNQGMPVGNMQLSAFQSPFVAANITNPARYLGDAGATSNQPGVQRTFELIVPANTTIALVVFNVEQSPGGQGGTYQIDLSDNPCGSAPATDFNHTATPDYVLYNGGTRRTAVWYLNNNVFASGAFGPILPAGWPGRRLRRWAPSSAPADGLPWRRALRQTGGPGQAPERRRRALLPGRAPERKRTLQRGPPERRPRPGCHPPWSPRRLTRCGRLPTALKERRRRLGLPGSGHRLQSIP